MLSSSLVSLKWSHSYSKHQSTIAGILRYFDIKYFHWQFDTVHSPVNETLRCLFSSIPSQSIQIEESWRLEVNTGRPRVWEMLLEIAEAWFRMTSFISSGVALASDRSIDNIPALSLAAGDMILKIYRQSPSWTGNPEFRICWTSLSLEACKFCEVASSPLLATFTYFLDVNDFLIGHLLGWCHADIRCNDVCFNSPEFKRMSPSWFLTMITTHTPASHWSK